jgi:hypothetical protein
MALADPQVVTVATVAKSMPRVSTTSGNNQRKSLYQMVDRTYSLEVVQRDIVRNKRPRQVALVTLLQRANVTDPLNSDLIPETVVWSVQLDRPLDGFTQTQVTDMWTGFKTWYDSTMVGKVFGGEN